MDTSDPMAPYSPFYTRSDYDQYLTVMLVENDGAGGIAAYCVDEGVGVQMGMVRVQIRHRLRNLFQPARRVGIELALQEAIDYGRPAGVHVAVMGSCMPLWLRWCLR